MQRAPRRPLAVSLVSLRGLGQTTAVSVCATKPSDVELFFDGTTVSVNGRSIGGYTQFEIPGTLDHLIEALRAGHDIALPGADPPDPPPKRPRRRNDAGPPKVDQKAGDYDGIQATHVVSGLVASAAKLMRIRVAGRPHDPGSIVVPVLPAPGSRNDFPVECRADWAEICTHRERTGGLPGCLAEVRRELSRGLELLDAGRPCDAVSQWQLGYVHNWGELAICALMMLHIDLANTRSS